MHLAQELKKIKRRMNSHDLAINPSLLIAIALDQKLINSTQQKISNFFQHIYLSRMTVNGKEASPFSISWICGLGLIVKSSTIPKTAKRLCQQPVTGLKFLFKFILHGHAFVVQPNIVF